MLAHMRNHAIYSHEVCSTINIMFFFRTTTIYFLIFSFILFNIDKGKTEAESRTFNVFGTIKSSLKSAGKFLGIEKANDIADLVSETFGKNNIRKGDTQDNLNGNVFSSFLRMFGFDAKRIGAIALNSIVFVAQMLTRSLGRSKPFLSDDAKKIPVGTPLDWFKNKPEVQSQMSYITDSELPNDIVEYIKERSLDESTDCIQLLICKSTPFVWGMQKSLSGANSTVVSGMEALFQYLPTAEEFLKNGERCEKQHPYCYLGQL